MARVLYLLVFVAATAIAQTAPAFDVATVKPSLPPGAAGRVGRVAGPFFDASRVSWWNAPLRFYTMQAYGLTTAWRIEGDPAWFQSENFDITATFPPETPKEQVPAMLKALLTERFHLAAHTEPRPHDVYVLTVAKTRLKAKESAVDDTTMTNRMGTGHMDLHKTSMQRLADLLSGETLKMSERPVVDMTNLKGVYDMTLDWSPEAAPTAEKPSLFTAVTEQLGLKLEAQKTPVEILVIDHAEKPSGN
ncbi:MAG TPA: TIGR03435 family protein [Bryobacteraceae bacterium]|jgi:uncharacterized protein (TIGR03435 family)